MALKNFFYNNMDTCKEQYTENRPMCPTKDIRYDIGCTKLWIEYFKLIESDFKMPQEHRL